MHSFRNTCMTRTEIPIQKEKKIVRTAVVEAKETFVFVVPA